MCLDLVSIGEKLARPLQDQNHVLPVFTGTLRRPSQPGIVEKGIPIAVSPVPAGSQHRRETPVPVPVKGVEGDGVSSSEAVVYNHWGVCPWKVAGQRAND